MKHIIRGLYIVMALSITSFAMPVQAEDSAPRFFQYMNDVPLMDGLYETTEDTLIFEKPEGRIITTTALSENQSPQNIETFYAQSLPQLGWAQTGENTYQRQNETLRIQTKNQENFSVARFVLEPQ